ncbi:hypothetical protein J3T78_05790 [Staphylococcus nepalensis]|uniref:hypothetical protein n=1 Tax=Staphylococcus nepalensis TaxID=214473 RepID=UPI001A992C66|nr:hypothetical protein [Staphylococcus nepalensis]MBO1217518.1 hypothetical protein [Staphylococcus nepalensis]MBO1237224.1 hypothetical protein [Staphylococcus nepalensis]
MMEEFKKDHKMVKVDKEVHSLLKVESATNGESRQNLVEKAIKNYIHISRCIE